MGFGRAAELCGCEAWYVREWNWLGLGWGGGGGGVGWLGGGGVHPPTELG